MTELFFKEYLTRLTYELLLSQGNHEKDLSSYEPNVELPSWLLSEEIMAPLFHSYDKRIEELHSVIQQQGTYLDLITQRLTYLLSENEILRNVRAAGATASLKDSSAPVLGEKTTLENELLMEQSDLLVEELKSLNCALSEREKTITALSSDLEKKVQLISQYEQESELMDKKYSKAENRRQVLEQDLTKERHIVETLKRQLSESQSKESHATILLKTRMMEDNECEVETAKWSEQVRNWI